MRAYRLSKDLVIIILRILGDLPVLTKLAGEVATYRANREAISARKEVIERLFLYWVYVYGGGKAIDGKVKLSSPVYSHTTLSILTLTQNTPLTACLTKNFFFLFFA